MPKANTKIPYNFKNINLMDCDIGAGWYPEIWIVADIAHEPNTGYYLAQNMSRINQANRLTASAR